MSPQPKLRSFWYLNLYSYNKSKLQQRSVHTQARMRHKWAHSYFISYIAPFTWILIQNKLGSELNIRSIYCPQKQLGIFFWSKLIFSLKAILLGPKIFSGSEIMKVWSFVQNYWFQILMRLDKCRQGKWFQDLSQTPRIFFLSNSPRHK